MTSRRRSHDSSLPYPRRHTISLRPALRPILFISAMLALSTHSATDASAVRGRVSMSSSLGETAVGATGRRILEGAGGDDSISGDGAGEDEITVDIRDVSLGKAQAAGVEEPEEEDVGGSRTNLEEEAEDNADGSKLSDGPKSEAASKSVDGEVSCVPVGECMMCPGRDNEGCSETLKRQKMECKRGEKAATKITTEYRSCHRTRQDESFLMVSIA